MTDKKGPNHSTRSNNKKLPGIIKPGSSPNAIPKVKVITAPGTVGAPPAPQPPKN